MSLAQHVMLRLTDGRVIAPTVAARRLLARSCLRVGADFSLLAARGSDTHTHLVALCGRPAAGELARRVEISLTRTLALPVGFERARIKPVEDQRHLSHLFEYCMRQEQHHGICADPLFDASNLPDLLGMRLLGAYTREAVHRYLPRVRHQQLLEYLNVPDLLVMAICPEDLADAAAGAFSLPDVKGRSRDAVDARCAAAHLLQPAVGRAELARLLGVSPRAVGNALARPALAAAVRAVQLQMQLRSGLRQRGPTASLALR